MIQSLFNGSSIPILEQVINFAQARHNVLAGNIANLDTPGYRARDLSVTAFQDRLQKAIEARDEPSPRVTPGVVTNQSDHELEQVADSVKTILFHDGSDVGLEQQINEISKNQMMHNMAIGIMTSQFRTLQAAVTERV